MTTKKKTEGGETATELRAKANAACAAWQAVCAERPVPREIGPSRLHDEPTLEQKLAMTLNRIDALEFEAKESPLREAAIEAVKAAEAVEPDPLLPLREAIIAIRTEETELVETLRLCRERATKAESELEEARGRHSRERDARGEPRLGNHTRFEEVIGSDLANARNQEIDIRSFLQRMHEASSDAERNYHRNMYRKLSSVRLPTDNEREQAARHLARVGA